MGNLPGLSVYLGLLALISSGWAAMAAHPLGMALFYWLAAWSGLTFMVYALDKWLAIQQSSRISERALHLLALIGGWPGAAFGQWLCRHKISKPSFMRLYGLTVLVNFAIWLWLLFSFGQIISS